MVYTRIFCVTSCMQSWAKARVCFTPNSSHISRCCAPIPFDVCKVRFSCGKLLGRLIELTLRAWKLRESGWTPVLCNGTVVFLLLRKRFSCGKSHGRLIELTFTRLKITSQKERRPFYCTMGHCGFHSSNETFFLFILIFFCCYTTTTTTTTLLLLLHYYTTPYYYYYNYYCCYYYYYYYYYYY